MMADIKGGLCKEGSVKQPGRTLRIKLDLSELCLPKAKVVWYFVNETIFQGNVEQLKNAVFERFHVCKFTVDEVDVWMDDGVLSDDTEVALLEDGDCLTFRCLADQSDEDSKGKAEDGPVKLKASEDGNGGPKSKGNDTAADAPAVRGSDAVVSGTVTGEEGHNFAAPQLTKKQAMAPIADAEEEGGQEKNPAVEAKANDRARGGGGVSVKKTAATGGKKVVGQAKPQGGVPLNVAQAKHKKSKNSSPSAIRYQKRRLTAFLLRLEAGGMEVNIPPFLAEERNYLLGRVDMKAWRAESAGSGPASAARELQPRGNSAAPQRAAAAAAGARGKNTNQAGKILNPARRNANDFGRKVSQFGKNVNQPGAGSNSGRSLYQSRSDTIPLDQDLRMPGTLYETNNFMCSSSSSFLRDDRSPWTSPVMATDSERSFVSYFAEDSRDDLRGQASSSRYDGISSCSTSFPPYESYGEFGSGAPCDVDAMFPVLGDHARYGGFSPSDMDLGTGYDRREVGGLHSLMGPDSRQQFGRNRPALGSLQSPSRFGNVNAVKRPGLSKTQRRKQRRLAGGALNAAATRLKNPLKGILKNSSRAAGEQGIAENWDSKKQLGNSANYHDIVCDRYPVLNGPPCVKDVIAFKALDEVEEFGLESAKFKVGKVLQFDGNQQEVLLELTESVNLYRETGYDDDVEIMDADDYTEEVVMDLSNFADIRLVKRTA